MINIRATQLFAVAYSATAVVVVALVVLTGSIDAEAQANGRLVVRVVDESTGELTERPTCYVLYRNEELHEDTRSAPAELTFAVPAGNYIVQVGPCANNVSYKSVWHDGSVVSIDPPPLAIEVQAGRTKEVTIPLSSGEFIAEFDGDASGCFIDIYPGDDLAFDSLLWRAREVDGVFRTVLASGEYQLVAYCGDSVRRYGTNSSRYLDDAAPLVIRDLEQLTVGYDRDDFVLDPRVVRLTTTVNSLSSDLFFCVDMTVPDGRTTFRQRAVSNGTSVEFLGFEGERRIRFWDCAGVGFDDVWYPNASNHAEAETISVGSSEDPIELGSLVQLVVDPALVCEGKPATIVGTDGDDTLVGTEGDDVIMGLAGRDTIRAGNGKDTICGGAGRDRLFGGRHADRIFGGDQGDLINGQAGRDVLLGLGGRDRLIGANGADSLRGGGGAADRLDGRGGDDFCHDPSPATDFTDCETLAPR